jgi:hypothetical protein
MSDGRTLKRQLDPDHVRNGCSVDRLDYHSRGWRPVGLTDPLRWTKRLPVDGLTTLLAVRKGDVPIRFNFERMNYVIDLYDELSWTRAAIDRTRGLCSTGHGE